MNAIYDRGASLLRTIYGQRIHTPAVLDLDSYFPSGRRFVSRWQDLRREALQIRERIEAVPRFEQVMAEQCSISASDKHFWRIFIAKAYGLEIAHNLARCPSLADLLRESPEVLSASFSFLAPGKHVPRHRGPFRGILRFHLGLSMPLGSDGTPAAVLTICDCEHRITDGQCLLWDDTYPHEVRNWADEIRIALVLDVWRPSMRADMRLLSRLIVRLVQLGIRHRGPASHGLAVFDPASCLAPRAARE